MAQNFISCDREQVMLLPPSLTDWLPEDHLVWTVLGAVEQINLDGFYGAYRANGQGRAAYDPAMMVALQSRRSWGAHYRIRRARRPVLAGIEQAPAHPLGLRARRGRVRCVAACVRKQ